MARRLWPSPNGRVIGATLDRNGLRPGRYVVTKDNLVVLASEAGVLDVRQGCAPEGRLQPGRMFLVDTVQQRIISDARSRSSWPAVSLMQPGSRSSRSTSISCPSLRDYRLQSGERCCAASELMVTARKT